MYWNSWVINHKENTGFTVQGWKTSKWGKSCLWWLSYKTNQWKTFTLAGLFFKDKPKKSLWIFLSHISSLVDVFCHLTEKTHFSQRASFLCIIVERQKRISGETSHPCIFLSWLCTENNFWNHILSRIFYCWIIIITQ